jgi:hypothetical protein
LRGRGPHGHGRRDGRRGWNVGIGSLGDGGKFGIVAGRLRHDRDSGRKLGVRRLWEWRRFAGRGHDEGQIEGGNFQERIIGWRLQIEFGLILGKRLRFRQRQFER